MTAADMRVRLALAAGMDPSHGVLFYGVDAAGDRYPRSDEVPDRWYLTCGRGQMPRWFAASGDRCISDLRGVVDDEAAARIIADHIEACR